MKRVERLIAWSLALVYLVAGWQKLVHPQVFADGIASFRILPPEFIVPVALGFPVLEIATAILLSREAWRRSGAFLSLGMTGVFTGIYGWTLMRGIEVQCSCFGGQEWLEVSTGMGVIRSVILLGASMVVYGMQVYSQVDRKSPLVRSG